jgi:hypothetical protein
LVEKCIRLTIIAQLIVESEKLEITKMKDIAIAIRIGSPNSTIDLVERTCKSIQANIGEDCDWKVFISLGLNISKNVKSFVEDFVEHNNRNFEIFEIRECTWASFINRAIELSSEYKYFIKSHDDIELKTKGFYKKVKETLDHIGKEVGWVSFTDIGWRIGDFSPSVRTGMFLDTIEGNAWENQKVFQFHTFPDNWTKAGWISHTIFRIQRLASKLGLRAEPKYPKPQKKIVTYFTDLPVKPVMCHAPFNHFVLIKRESLEKIGLCEDWGTKNALLVDEDWGLRALQLNLPNLWIPDIEYFHDRGDKFQGGGTRSWSQITGDALRVHQLFKDKWGFNENPTQEDIQFVREKYKDTLIPWSSYRRSYDWDYKI